MPDHPSSNPLPRRLRRLAAGGDLTRGLDLLLVNTPLRDYAARPRVNDVTLPVLGLAYIATYAAQHGHNVAVLDAEAHGLSIHDTVETITTMAPRWAGFNLLAPTYELSARIAAALPADILLMLGGHQAKAMPTEILADPRMAACRALVLGEAETRVAALLDDLDRRPDLPAVMWLDPTRGIPNTGGLRLGLGRGETAHWLAPDLNALPFVDRVYLPQDPRVVGGLLQANLVGSRGCPYNCSFCGAAASANPDIAIRTRAPANILAEMDALRSAGVEAFRFVDDLFLGAGRVIEEMMAAFTAERVGEWARWDATGRINVLHRVNEATLDDLVANGLREIALGIESASPRILQLIDKRITADMTTTVVRRLASRGIDVKGYFILGFPTETPEDIDATVALIHHLWEITDRLSGTFTASVFEYRPYPGTPDWHRLLGAGYTPAQLLDYNHVDLTVDGTDPLMIKRDEFNYSTGLQLAAAPIPYVRQALVSISRTQHQRNQQPAIDLTAAPAPATDQHP